MSLIRPFKCFLGRVFYDITNCRDKLEKDIDTKKGLLNAIGGSYLLPVKRLTIELSA